ncbi:hypothetical protein [Streptomyces sp. NPDC059909]|uniref:hypothetical protein n=1 Tax=Streptomyces sp. NPDC059909 TaxID=3346998 RepID=UPI0036642824
MERIDEFHCDEQRLNARIEEHIRPRPVGFGQAVDAHRQRRDPDRPAAALMPYEEPPVWGSITMSCFPIHVSRVLKS